MTNIFLGTTISNGIERDRTARVLVPSLPPPMWKERNYKVFYILMHGKCEVV